MDPRPFKDLNWTELELRAAEGTPHGYQAIAAARAEIRYREVAQRAEEFNAHESARIKGQQFQSGLVDRQIGASDQLKKTELEIANSAAKAARFAAWATAAAAIATFGQLVLQYLKGG